MKDMKHEKETKNRWTHNRNKAVKLEVKAPSHHWQRGVGAKGVWCKYYWKATLGYHVMISKNQRQHNTMCHMSIRSCHYFEQFFRRSSFSDVNCVFYILLLVGANIHKFAPVKVDLSGLEVPHWGMAMLLKMVSGFANTVALSTFWTFTCNFTNIYSRNYRLFCSLLFLILSFDLVATWWKWSTPRVYTCVRQAIQRGGHLGTGNRKWFF